MDHPKQPQIDRINELSGLARTAWFSLLGYLVFVGITLLGVRDADFFVPSRQTDLPLVGVQIPTASFFWTAPILGAALYTYLHLFLIKLWDAHGEAHTADADPTHHWLVGDFVLIRQRDPVARARPLAWLTILITVLLVWVAGPFVLVYAWWRSMPAHNEGLTLTIAACLWLTLLVGFASWWRAEERIGQPWVTPSVSRWQKSALVGLALLLAMASSMRTTNPLPWGGVNAIDPRHTTQARLNLSGTQLTVLPRDWQAWESARAIFQTAWCAQRDLPGSICEQLDWLNSFESASPFNASTPGNLTGTVHNPPLAELRTRMEAAWLEKRRGEIRNLSPIDLGNHDLRGMNGRDGSFVGMRLSHAHLDGAWLQGANFEGTDLFGAQMTQAHLAEAHLEAALVQDAKLRNADLSYATLDQANFEGAHLDGASLNGAHLAGAHFGDADLSRASLRHADLRGVDFRDAIWAEAELDGSLAQFADFRARNGKTDLTQAQLEGIVGNASTLLPDGPAPDTGKPFYVWSCWEHAPDRQELEIALRSENDFETAISLREMQPFLCGESRRTKSGTPLSIYAPYPAGHPLSWQPVIRPPDESRSGD